MIMRQETRIIAETSGEHVCQEFLASDAPGIALRPDEILHRLHLHKTLNTFWPHESKLQSCSVSYNCITYTSIDFPFENYLSNNDER